MNKPLIVFDPNNPESIELLKSIIKEAIVELKFDEERKPKNKIIEADEARELLGNVSQSTLNRFKSKKYYKFPLKYIHGRPCKYYTEDIRLFLWQNKRVD